ncbi:MAG TPA: T9SS type A sorting domain-containing protein [Candidatus Cloacimonadota bacterium]|nr:T9SS type A sorting domain-containing protein [Candidatus Cloacimonadota bacterium]
MKGKLLLLWLVLVTSSVFGQTWVRHLEWEDLIPAGEHNPVANAYNVIPSVDGGYIMQGGLTTHQFLVDSYTNIFWKVSTEGEVIWRNDQYTYDHPPLTCLVSNGVDKYYGLSSEYHRNILYTYDAQLNPINSIMVDTLLTNEEQIKLRTMILVDEGIVLSGYNHLSSFIMKMDFSYNITWSKTFQDLDSTGFNDIKRTLDGGVICAGGDDIVRMNPLGDTLWVYQIPAPMPRVFYIVCNPDGTYSALGYHDGIRSIEMYDQNGVYLGGNIYTALGYTRPYISVVGYPDGSVILLEAWFSGHALPWEDYGMLHKISLAGTILWNSIFLQHPYGNDVGHGSNPLFVDEQGYIVLCVDPMTVIKADENGTAVSNYDPILDTPGIVSVQAYPNPAKENINFVFHDLPKSAKLSMNIYNLRGQLLDQIAIVDNARGQQWELPTDLESGVYLVRIMDGSLPITSSKFTIIK